MDTSKDKEYSTDSLYLASYLLAKRMTFLGCTPSGKVTKSGIGISLFCFQAEPSLQAHISAFYNNADGIQDYLGSMKNLKDAMKSTSTMKGE